MLRANRTSALRFPHRPYTTQSELGGTTLLDLIAARQGHFRLESGHHGNLWLDLDLLFTEPARVTPLIDRLAHQLKPHDFSVVCGPMTGGAFLAQMLATTLEVEFVFTERMPPADANAMYAVHYRLPAGLRERVRAKRIAVVDDVISAGSAVRGTASELEAHGGVVALVGALLVLGSKAREYFGARGIPLIAADTFAYEMWLPADCPWCREGIPLEDPAAAKNP